MTLFASNSMGRRGAGSPIRRTLPIVPANPLRFESSRCRAVGLRRGGPRRRPQGAPAVTPAGQRPTLELVEKVEHLVDVVNPLFRRWSTRPCICLPPVRTGRASEREPGPIAPTGPHGGDAGGDRRWGNALVGLPGIETGTSALSE